MDYFGFDARLVKLYFLAIQAFLLFFSTAFADDSLSEQYLATTPNPTNTSPTSNFLVKVTFIRSTSSPSQVMAQTASFRDGCWKILDAKIFSDVGQLVATVENSTLVYRDTSKRYKNNLIYSLSLSTLEERREKSDYNNASCIK